MAKNLLYPSTRKTTVGARLRMRILPFGIRKPINYTITLTQNFNSNINPGIIFLKSNQDVYLTVETKLIYFGIVFEVVQDVVITTTETPVSILDITPNILIPRDSSFVTPALLLVSGCKSCTISPEIQTVETTNVSHGVEKEEKQTFNSKKISLDILEIYGDNGGNQFIELAENLTYRNFEFWFTYSYPDGSYKQGAAIITGYTINSNPNSLRSFRIEGRIQPKTYSYFNVL